MLCKDKHGSVTCTSIQFLSKPQDLPRLIVPSALSLWDSQPVGLSSRPDVWSRHLSLCLGPSPDRTHTPVPPSELREALVFHLSTHTDWRMRLSFSQLVETLSVPLCRLSDTEGNSGWPASCFVQCPPVFPSRKRAGDSVLPLLSCSVSQ